MFDALRTVEASDYGKVHLDPNKSALIAHSLLFEPRSSLAMFVCFFSSGVVCVSVDNHRRA